MGIIRAVGSQGFDEGLVQHLFLQRKLFALLNILAPSQGLLISTEPNQSDLLYQPLHQRWKLSPMFLCCPRAAILAFARDFSAKECFRVGKTCVSLGWMQPRQHRVEFAWYTPKS